MQEFEESRGKDATTLRSAGDSELKPEQQGWENEGGHMSSTAGRVVHVPGASLRVYPVAGERDRG
jgi:hypothetical protein